MKREFLGAVLGIVALSLLVVGWIDVAQASRPIPNPPAPDPDLSFAVVPSGAVKFLCPCKSAIGLQDPPYPATITVTLLDYSGQPVNNWPREKVRLIFVNEGAGTANYCPGDQELAFAPTNSNNSGLVEFKGYLGAGGWMDVGSVRVQIDHDGDWYTLTGGDNGGSLDVLFNSPDLNGDNAVNLADFGDFVFDYRNGIQFRSDLLFDNKLDLADVGILIQHYGHSCQ